MKRVRRVTIEPVPLVLAAAVFLAATPWARAFDVAGGVWLLALAALLSVSISAYAIRVRRSAPAESYAVSAVGLLVLLVAACGFHPNAIWDGLVHGPDRVLSETLPVGGGRAVLAAPIVLTWLCGSASAELITRSRRPLAGSAMVGLAIPAASYVLPFSISASRPGPNVSAAAALLVSLAVAALLLHQAQLATTTSAQVGPAVAADPPRPRWHPAGSEALAGVAAVAAVLGLVVPTLPGVSGKPASLNRSAPLVADVVVDPVDSLAAVRDGSPGSPAVPVLRLVTNRPSTGYLGMAVLDSYDGAVWTFDSTFHPTGGRVPPEPAGAIGAGASLGLSTIRQSDTVLAPWPIPLLPVIGRPTRVGGVDVAVDATTGMLLPARPVAVSGHYSVVSQAPGATLGTVSPADGFAGGASDLAAVDDLAQPPNSTVGVGTALRFLSLITGRRPAATVGFLQAALVALHTADKRVVPATPPTKPTSPSNGKKGSRKGVVPAPAIATSTAGTSLSEVVNAVTVNRSGSPEQFASLFAVVARYLGVPARVVTGFRVPASSDSGPVGAGAYEVTNRQAWTWVEVPVAGVGWVVADPTPDAVTPVSAPPPVPVQAPSSLPQSQANAVPRNEITGGHALAKPARVPRARVHSLAAWEMTLIIVGTLAVIALGGPAFAGARRITRRRARRQADSSALAVGAWLELLDGLHQAGFDPGAGATTAEVAEEAGLQFGPDVPGPVLQVGDLADLALCSSSPPTPAAAEEAWRTQHSVRREILAGLDRRQRARALVSVGQAPRSPVRRSGR